MPCKRTLLLSSLLFSLSLFAFAEGTKTWQQSTFDEFSRGTTKGIAIRSDGSLELAPSFQSLHSSPATYIWSIASDSAGNIYVGTGSPARVYRITPDGKATVIFQPKELQVQAVSVDGDGIIYAATSPDGMVYKIVRGQKAGAAAAVKAEIKAGDAKPAEVKPDPAKEVDKTPVDPDYTSSVFFDPKTKYIWSMAFDSEGRLYVATGDRGEIFRVNKDGASSLFFKSDEAHIRAVLVHPDGNLIAGSDGSGLVYRISPAGEGFVIYSAGKKEITALAVDKAGNLYVAGVGEKRVTAPLSPSILLQSPPPPGAQPPNQPTSPFVPSFSSSGGSEIYMITVDGSPKRLWSHREDIVYALAFDANGRLLAGSGNKGRLLAIANNGDFVDLQKASASQITGFAPTPKGDLYVATSNLGKVFLMSAESAEEGVFESEVFDARIFSRWGRMEVEGSGKFDIYSRSGNVDNPDRNWSAWKQVALDKDSVVEAPSARFVQWKLVVPPRSQARVETVRLNYLPKNVPPVMEEVAVQTGARFNVSPSAPPRTGNETVMVGLGSQPSLPSGILNQPRVDSPVAAQKDRSFIAVRWSVRDENEDTLTYSVYYRGDGESRWKLLKDKIAEKQYSWDSGLLPDGGYTVRVAASDAPSHSPEDVLSDSKESPRFEVDNSAPRIEGLSARMEDGQLRVIFGANDTFSPIQRAEVSIDAGDWQFVEPVGQLSDAKTESYHLLLPVRPLAAIVSAASPAKKKEDKKSKQAKTDAVAPPVAETPETTDEHVVVVRVFDRFDNVSTAKVVVK